MIKVIYVDIDETICNTPNNPREYEKSVPIKKNIEKINRLYEEGHKIVYWTARGSTSGINWFKLTKSQLDSWGAKYHELRCNKPGYDVFIEDRSVTIEAIDPFRRIISHRGNIEGPDHLNENTIAQIEKCIRLGLDVEIDLRMKNGEPHLGHDFAQHKVTKEWLSENLSYLWIHVKEYEALVWLNEHLPHAVYFCHESDKFTLISNGFIWSHDLKNKVTGKCVIPLLSLKDINDFEFENQQDLYAICTDYVKDVLEKFSSARSEINL